MKNKVKFQPVTLVLSKKELKLLVVLVGSLSLNTEKQIIKGATDSFDDPLSLYNRLEKAMQDQGVKYPTADVIISVND